MLESDVECHRTKLEQNGGTVHVAHGSYNAKPLRVAQRRLLISQPT
ncbi:uncharacterized protein BCN122_I2381 [Burkholderia cenocepacia]|nr:uncharacterized protein BCN122_I2381 [Burkholderia cenocepacia]